MHTHRTGSPWPAHVARPDTPEYEQQRRLVLELAVEPPEEGDDPRELASVLGYPRAVIEAAADALVRAGLAERDSGRIFAAPATRALDALWPLAL